MKKLIILLLIGCIGITSAYAYTTEIDYINCDMIGMAFSKPSCAIQLDKESVINCTTGMSSLITLDPVCVDYIVDFKLIPINNKLNWNNCAIAFTTIDDLPNGVEKYKALISTCGEIP